MPLLKRLAGFLRRRGKILLATWLGLSVVSMVVLSNVPECHRAQVVLGSDSATGYQGQIKMLIARVTSTTVLEEVAARSKLDEPLDLGERLAGLPSDPALRLRAHVEVEGEPGSVERVTISVEGCEASGATTAAQALAERIIEYDRQLRRRTIAQRARGEDTHETTGKPARVLLEELRQANRQLRDSTLVERFQREEGELAEEEIAVLALRKRHEGLVEQARNLGELVRREAKSAYEGYREELARAEARERELAKRAEAERQQASREGKPKHVAQGALSSHEAELRRMLATRTRRHPDVRRLMRKIELLRAEAAQEAGESNAEEPQEEQSRPVGDLPRKVLPIADGDERPLGLGEELPSHWLQKAPRYTLWVEAQSQAAKARVELAAREQILARRKAEHAKQAKQTAKLERARLEEQRLLALQREEEALQARAEELPSVHEPLLIVEQARVISASTPWRTYSFLLLFLGGLVSLLGAYLVELQDRSFHAPADVAHRVSLPVLGVIPHLRGGR